MSRQMKDSGIEWIGEIPENWQCCKQKHMITLINGRAYSDSEFEEDGKYRILRVGNLFSNPQWYTSSMELEEDKYCNNGDLLYAWSMSYGPYIWDGERVIYHYHIWKVKPQKALALKFAYYYLQALTDSIKAETHETTMGFVTMGNMNNSYITFPKSINEQERIASFLDSQCAYIDTVIEKTKASIEEYKKLKQAVITQAVTKGVRGDRPMKDSGIEWIGEIPAEWNYGRIKYNTYLKGRIGWQGLRADEFIDDGPTLVTGMHFDGDEVAWDRCYHISEERFEEAPEIHLMEKDLLMTKDGTIGKVAYIINKPEKATLNSHLLLIRPTTNLFSNHFMKWLLKSDVFIMFYSLHKYGSIMDSISQEQFKAFNFYLPDMVEQEEIACYLDVKSDEIDKLIVNKQAFLDKLISYKKSLIYEYVTGKKEVPVS